MTLIPKTITIQILVKTSDKEPALSAPITFTSVDGVCEWKSESVQLTLEPNILTQKTRCSLRLGKCRVDLQEFAITSDPSLLLEYMRQLAQKAIFGSNEEVPFLRWVFSVFGMRVYDDDAVLTLMNVCKPKEVSITWQPALPKKIYGVETLHISQNQTTPLTDFSNLCDAGPCLCHLGLMKDDVMEVLFESLRGINTLTNLRTLQLDRGALPNIQENAQYIVLPNLVELQIHDLDLDAFLDVLRQCPSLEIICVVSLNLRANLDFFLHCEDACKSPDGAKLRKTFENLKELSFDLSGVDMINFMLWCHNLDRLFPNLADLHVVLTDIAEAEGKATFNQIGVAGLIRMFSVVETRLPHLLNFSIECKWFERTRDSFMSILGYSVQRHFENRRMKLIFCS
ncbi:hypothetical protein HDU76_005727 [Blyttiomyces sp. JEL0837]|nr:hypothetical protein HDU76_005727 [Blyttiomyces sp. JEL0837]